MSRGLGIRSIVRQAFHRNATSVRIDGIDCCVVRFKDRKPASVRVPDGSGYALPEALSKFVNRHDLLVHDLRIRPPRCRFQPCRAPRTPSASARM